MINVKVHTAIITAPRPRSMLQTSVDGFRRAGFTGSIVVCSDGGAPADDPDTFTIVNEVRLGNKLNWDRALSVLVTQAEPGEWLMVCEDDIAWAKGSAVALTMDLAALMQSQALAKNNVGALSLYAPRKHTNGAGKLADGWHHANMQYGRKTWGAQCMLFTYEQAVWLQSNETYRGFMVNQKMDKNIDLILGTVINGAGRNIMYRIPCLVDHIGGDNSSLGYAPGRANLETDYFRGPRA